MLFLSLVVISSIGNPEPSSAQNSRKDSISVGGLERTYSIYIPSSYEPTKPIPTLFLFLGGGGTGQLIETLTLSRFNRIADREGFIVLYPDGIEKHWNDGRGVQAFRAHRENIDDVGFISALIDHLIRTFNVDAFESMRQGFPMAASFHSGWPVNSPIEWRPSG